MRGGKRKRERRRRRKKNKKKERKRKNRKKKEKEKKLQCNVYEEQKPKHSSETGCDMLNMYSFIT
jgi:hypothetical protein